MEHEQGWHMETRQVTEVTDLYTYSSYKDVLVAPDGGEFAALSELPDALNAEHKQAQQWREALEVIAQAHQGGTGWSIVADYEGVAKAALSEPEATA